uniref:Uncharacterized protein n=1 Tax=Triticum urartu TaxID=4572 RepID=A0A8R7PGQ8_TRIUA
SYKREEIIRGEEEDPDYNFSTDRLLRKKITPFRLRLPHEQKQIKSVSREIISPETQPGILAQAVEVATKESDGGRRQMAGVAVGAVARDGVVASGERQVLDRGLSQVWGRGPPQEIVVARAGREVWGRGLSQGMTTEESCGGRS